MIDAKSLFFKNIEAHGKQTEILKLFEEMSELQEAICKYEDCRDSIDHIAEEIADVQIMLEQMMIIYDNKPYVESWRRVKLEKMEKKLC